MLEISGTASAVHAQPQGGVRSNSLKNAARRNIFESPVQDHGGYPAGHTASSAGDGGGAALIEDGSSPTRSKRMVRAKDWTPQVEDLYRLQFCGWRDEEEYSAAYGTPE